MMRTAVRCVMAAILVILGPARSALAVEKEKEKGKGRDKGKEVTAYQSFTQTVWRLQGEGTRKHAVQDLQRLAADTRSGFRLHARAALARHLRAQGKATEALALVDEFSGMRPENVAYPAALCFVESAVCRARLNEPVNAFRMLDYARERSAGLAAVWTRLALADAVEPVPELERALAFLREGLRYGDAWFERAKVSETGELAPAKPDAEFWPPLRREVEARVREVQRRIDIEKWGYDYVLYREAQEARQANTPLSLDFTSLAGLYRKGEVGQDIPGGGDYRAAIAKYDEIIKGYPESVFAEAARMYRCVCLAKLGELNEARRGLRQFIEAQPDGLYRGEAMWLMGELLTQTQWDGGGAEFYEMAVKWCRRIRTLATAVRLYAVPEKCAEPAKPPAENAQMDDFGVISPVNVPPGAVVNQITAAWYLNDIEKNSEYGLGFLKAVSGDWAAARDHFLAAAELDPLLQQAEREKYFNEARRLKSACERRSFVGEAEENDGLKAKVAMAMMFADFCHLRGLSGRAESLYRRIAGAAQADQDDKAAARAGLGRILVALKEGQMDLARTVSAEVVQRWPKAPSTPYACFLGGHACGSSSNSYAEAVARYRMTHVRYPKSRVAEMARYFELFKTLSPETLEKSRPLIADFRKRYPDSVYLPAIDDKVRFLESFVNGGNRQ